VVVIVVVEVVLLWCMSRSDSEDLLSMVLAK
jgi:hypothetical protein